VIAGSGTAENRAQWRLDGPRSGVLASSTSGRCVVVGSMPVVRLPIGRGFAVPRKKK
jgi:hypothetical protein